MKSWLHKLAVAALIFPLGFLFGSHGKMVYEANTFHPWAWSKNDPPIIVNCYGKELEKSYIESALAFWEPYGHTHAFIVEEPMKEICDNKMLEGFILLKKAKGYHDENTLAYTTRKVALFRIRGAVITFNPGAYRLDYVFEHELGHAFGYQHLEKDGHIMHPHFENMGERFGIP